MREHLKWNFKKSILTFDYFGTHQPSLPKEFKKYLKKIKIIFLLNLIYCWIINRIHTFHKLKLFVYNLMFFILWRYTFSDIIIDHFWFHFQLSTIVKRNENNPYFKWTIRIKIKIKVRLKCRIGLFNILQIFTQKSFIDRKVRLVLSFQLVIRWKLQKRFEKFEMRKFHYYLYPKREMMSEVR